MSSILATMINIRRVCAIQVCTGWNAVGITIPDRSSVVGGVQAERVRMLTYKMSGELTTYDEKANKIKP